MAVKVVHEREFFGGIIIPVLERCCKCRTLTPYWYPTKPRDCALCPECAKKVKRITDIPLKTDWCKFERAIDHIVGRIYHDWYADSIYDVVPDLVDIGSYYGDLGVRLAADAFAKEIGEILVRRVERKRNAPVAMKSTSSK